jgi:hypothetical protein
MTRNRTEIDSRRRKEPTSLYINFKDRSLQVHAIEKKPISRTDDDPLSILHQQAVASTPTIPSQAKPPWLIILFVNVQKIHTILVISKGEKQSAHVH